jgi:cytochrome c-type biogenesis protein CcmH
MLWGLFVLLSALVLAPAAFAFVRARGARGRRAAAMALYRAQLAELARERAENRIGEAEHALAVREVDRRLLAADAEPDEAAEARPGRKAGIGLVACVLAAVPLVALALYLPAGDPGLPAAPLAPRLAAARAQHQEMDRLIADLHQRLAALDPKSREAREGFLLLGRAEAENGDFAAAASAWRAALADGFDPALAAATAEAETRAAGRVNAKAADLFRQALAQAPADAPWRALAEQRLAEAGGN